MKPVTYQNDYINLKKKEQTMKTPYLIQRANFVNCKSRKSKKGIDSILRFDYMGSAEFEFGSLPKSLKRIRATINDYTVDRITINGNPVNIFCKSDDLNDVVAFLNMLSETEYPRMKEQPRFYNYLKGEKSKYESFNIDHWWDIENDFMFWRDKKGFDDKFLEAMGV